jgi:probable rRNA maturation factor
MIDIQFDPQTLINLRPERIREAISATLEVLKKPDQDLTLRLIDDQEMQQLNQTFRGEDKTTDVLSFNQDIQDPETGQFYLGDILISLPQATRQAAEHGHSLEKEVAFLAIHGTLHLSGYDHYTPEEKAVMWPLQDQIFADLKTKWSQEPE